MLLLAFALGCAACSRDVAAQDAESERNLTIGLPADAVPFSELDSEGVTAYRSEQTIWLVLDSAAFAGQAVDIPRLCAPIRSLAWKDRPDHPLEFVPEPQSWRLSWKSAPPAGAVIELNCDAPPVLPSESLFATPTGDGSVMLHAYQAETHGEKLRFEPQPYKNTVGYWTVPTDFAVWQLSIDQPGLFAVELLQGCGTGQGGSAALLTLQHDEEVDAELSFETVDTGHFQNFRWFHAGTIRVTEAGRFQLRIEPKRIAHAALFDVRAIHLVRQAQDAE